MDARPAQLDRDDLADARRTWALGSYHRFAKQTIWQLGPVLVEACGTSAGQRVLDVAAGTGNVAIRAAEAGANVVAADLTPENFEAGRREAREHGVDVEWVEADAQDLPFDDGEFDVVMSCFGAIFAPDHQAVADELVRVCRPGGTIGLVTFLPEGTGEAFFTTLARHAPPPPPGAPSPLQWGDPEHVRDRLGNRVAALETSRRQYVERASSPAAYVRLFTETFGPVIALLEMQADQPARRALERDLHEFANVHNRGEPGGTAEYPYGYLLAVARTATR